MHLRVFVKRIPYASALLAALFVLVLTTVFAVRPDVLRLGLATVSVPGSTVSAPDAADSASSPLAQETAAMPTPVAKAEQRFAARVGITHQAIDLEKGVVDTRKLRPLPPQKLQEIDGETLWLARAVYSETNRPEEMELVAWAIRNRVETGYRGRDSYKEVVLDPWQFSAFNENSGKRSYFVNLTPKSKVEMWQEALTIAHLVKQAPASLRPFPRATRHYYSERSMVGRSKPDWAVGEAPVTPNRPFQLRAERFRFYQGIS